MKQYLPFYMKYQPVLQWEDDWCYQRDYDYMKSAYPDVVKRIMPYVEEECDRLEYAGSMMYDEYPDQLQLRLLCRRICDKVKILEMNGKKDTGEWLMNLIWVVTWQEILKRRNEYRKYRKKLY